MNKRRRKKALKKWSRFEPVTLNEKSAVSRELMGITNRNFRYLVDRAIRMADSDTEVPPEETSSMSISSWMQYNVRIDNSESR